MIHKVHYLNSIIAILLVSCATVKTKLEVSAVNGDSMNSRAIDVSEDHFVVAGQNGTVSFFENPESQIVDSVLTAEDIRDIQIIGNGSLVLMNSGKDGMIWKTSYAMTNPIQTYYQKDQFLDGMAFWNGKNGVIYGDPVDGKFIVLLTEDAGKSWFPLNTDDMPYALPNESGFAASGTGIAALGQSKIIFATGMADTARLFISEDKGKTWNVKPTPIKSGDSYGIYSIYFWSENEGLIVGGSYLHPEDNENNCFLTVDGGDIWIKGGNGLGGYISCVNGNEDGSFLVATGRVGTDYSVDRGKNWHLLLKKKFYTVKVDHNKLFFSGKDGVIEVYSYTVRKN